MCRGDMLRLSDVYTWAVKTQDQGVEMAPCCLEEASHSTAELAEARHQDREFMARVLNCFVSTYDAPDWH